MFDWQQESFIPPEAFSRDEKSVEVPIESSDLYLLLDKQLLVTMAEDYSRAQGTGDVLSAKKTMDLLSRYLPSNESELSEVLFRKDAKPDEFTGKIGAALPAFLYLLVIFSGKSHQDAIQAAESGIVVHYLEHSADVIGSYFSAAALWKLTEMAKPEWSIAEEKYKEVKVVDQGVHEPEFISKAYEYRQYIAAQVNKMRLYVMAFRKKIGQDPDTPFPRAGLLVESETNLESYRTKYPAEFIFPSDKVTSKTFGKDLLNGKKILSMERSNSKKQINAAVQIDFDNIPGVTIFYPGGLNEYDREVHDAIVTQHIAGNTHFSPQMLYQALTGDPEARLVEKQTEAIRQSINKLMNCKITIDATDEAQARGWKKGKYEGRLIVWDKVTAELNGTSVECYRLLRTPILYEYASQKGQIARADIRLLNSPINKNEEAIILQGYLMRRIMAMKGKSQLTPSILYSTIFEQLHIDAPSKSALRMKKAQIRNKTKSILDFWVEKNFISGYQETTKGTAAYSIEISLK